MALSSLRSKDTCAGTLAGGMNGVTFDIDAGLALFPLRFAFLGQLGQALAQLLDLALQDLELLRLRVERLAARRPIGYERLGIGFGLNQRGARRDADHGGTFGHVARDDGIGADARARADDDGPEHRRARSDDDAVRQGRVALAGDAVARVGAAERHRLIDG